MNDDILSLCESFQWDEGNARKSYEKHGISQAQCEQVFFNEPLLLLDDAKHSQREPRYYALGKTDADERLFIVFTVRETSIRVISARRMNKKERQKYEQA